MTPAESKIEFKISAEDQQFLASMKRVTAQFDALEKKQKSLANGPKTASDRQLNKALGQDSAGDFLELFGISEQSLSTIKTAGIAIAGFNAALSTTSKVLDGIRKDKSASEIWTDIAKGIPILGGVAAAADDAGRAIGEYYANLDGLMDADKRARADFQTQKQLLAGITAGGASARNQLRISSSENANVTSAQIDYEAAARNVAEKRKQIEALGRGSISDIARAAALKDLDDTLQAASDKVVRAQMEVDQKKADLEKKEREKRFKDLRQELDDEQKERLKRIAENAKQLSEAKYALNQQSMEASASLLDEINGMKLKMAEKTLQDQLSIGKQTRTGALAESFGIGSANQVASRERASANPVVKLMEDAARRDERKLAALETLARKAEQGEVSLVGVFN